MRILPLLLAVVASSPFAPAQDTPPRPQGSGGADPSDDAFEMGSPPALQEGMSEEQMWPAASAEQWAEPCLVHWQRTFSDALRVAREQRRPLMVCVNMDGEIASEHFAGVRYREPATAELMSRYACVIASVYRHTPRDYDEHGNRVECPRFGTVTCGEHIEAERELYEKYFDGKRVSPRHIVLDPATEKETYDVYYSWDTATVFTTFRRGAEGWPEPEEPKERTMEDLARSSDVDDRERLEELYRSADVLTKREILRVLVEKRRVDQVEVLRASIFGLDLELARLGRRALAQCDTEAALDLIAEALKVPLGEPERELLLGAVERMARTSPRARTLVALHSGLAADSRHIDAERLAAREGYESSRGTKVLADASAAAPKGPAELLDLAEALLAQAQDSKNARFASLLASDARQAVRDAEAAGASGARLDAVDAVVSSALGDRASALGRAVTAVEAGALGDGEGADAPQLTDESRAELLRLFGEARRAAIRRAYRGTGEWPPAWLSDVNASYATLAADDQVHEGDLVAHQDFLRWIGATPRADEVLDEGLRRFPDSAALHERLRGRALWKGGPAALEQEYAARLRDEDVDITAEAARTQITWFAGYASVVAAEHRRRRGELDEGLAAYDRAIVRFRRNAVLYPAGADNAHHYVALALAGRARVMLERNDLARATDALVSALETRPDSAASLDGLGLSPIMTAKMLKARLEEAGDSERTGRVEAALAALDPKLLEPPPSERRVDRRGRRRGGR